MKFNEIIYKIICLTKIFTHIKVNLKKLNYRQISFNNYRFLNDDSPNKKSIFSFFSRLAHICNFLIF